MMRCGPGLFRTDIGPSEGWHFLVMKPSQPYHTKLVFGRDYLPVGPWNPAYLSPAVWPTDALSAMLLSAGNPKAIFEVAILRRYVSL